MPRNLSKYALLAGGTGLTAALVAEAKADVTVVPTFVYHNQVDNTFTFDNNGLDLYSFSGGIPRMYLGHTSQYVNVAYTTGSGPLSSPTYFAKNFTYGQLIGSSSGPFTFQTAMLNAYNTSSGETFGNFATTGYIGINFHSGEDGLLHYGWLEYTVDGPGTGYIDKIGWETTPGLAVAAGSSTSVPEPSTLGMLAAGAAGLAFMRSRRKKTA